VHCDPLSRGQLRSAWNRGGRSTNYSTRSPRGATVKMFTSMVHFQFRIETSTATQCFHIHRTITYPYTDRLSVLHRRGFLDSILVCREHPRRFPSGRIPYLAAAPLLVSQKKLLSDSDPAFWRTITGIGGLFSATTNSKNLPNPS
jgi:hypothetical protein